MENALFLKFDFYSDVHFSPKTGDVHFSPKTGDLANNSAGGVGITAVSLQQMILSRYVKEQPVCK